MEKNRKDAVYPRAIAWTVAGFLGLALIAYGLFQLLNPDARTLFFVVATCVILFLTAGIHDWAKKRERQRHDDHP